MQQTHFLHSHDLCSKNDGSNFRNCQLVNNFYPVLRVPSIPLVYILKTFYCENLNNVTATCYINNLFIKYKVVDNLIIILN